MEIETLSDKGRKSTIDGNNTYEVIHIFCFQAQVDGLESEYKLCVCMPSGKLFKVCLSYSAKRAYETCLYSHLTSIKIEKIR